MVLDPKERRLCSACIEEPYLRALIEKTGDAATCSYCEQTGRTFVIDLLADHVDSALSEFFRPIDPGAGEGQLLIDVISVWAEIGPQPAQDIRLVLAGRGEDTKIAFGFGARPFDLNTRYARTNSIDASDFESDWFTFERSLKTKARYFNPAAERTLTSIFEGLDGHDTINGRPVIVEVGPGKELSSFYRARCFESKKELEEAMMRPDLLVGPPHRSKAVANRMNASGISVFYGATDKKVALAEIRPPVKSRVLIAEFEVTRSLRLLDIEALQFITERDGSIFDENYLCRLRKATFLKGLSRHIARPVMPNDQHRDYLPTQALADFLATEESFGLDGIIYPSSQVTPPPRQYLRPGSPPDMRNVVLFHKSARVRVMEIPPGVGFSVYRSTDLYSNVAHLIAGRLKGMTEIADPRDNIDDVSAFLDDGPNVKYSVFERVASRDPRPNPNPDDAPTSYSDDDAPLRFVSLEHHYVQGIAFDTIPSQVDRHPLDQRER